MIVDLETLSHLWPETVLVIIAVMILVSGAFEEARWWWSVFAPVCYGIVAYVICRNELGLFQQGGLRLSGPLVVDYLGFVLRLLAVLVGTLFTLLAARIVRKELASEFIGTLMLLVVGMMLVARANDLVLLFVGLELISIPTYVLLYLGRRDRSTAEATAKYFFLSIFSSAVLLYGLSFLYGLAGTTILMADTRTASIAGILAGQSPSGAAPTLAAIALVLIVAGVGFKIAAVPFHFYAPDVYQGATNGNAGLLAVAPKIGGLAALVRVLVVAMPNVTELAWQLLLVISIASMTLGNVCALWQNNLRRLMAFSSIAHAGYLLIGIVVATGTTGNAAGNGIGAATLYLIVYTLASVGVFAALAYLGGTDHEVNGVDDLAGLSKTQPLAAASIALCLISLAGIPPLAGFWGKLTLFSGAIQLAANSSYGVWFAILAIVGVMNAAIAVAYYLRVISVMYFGDSKRDFGCEGGWGAQAAMVAATILVVAVGIFPGSVIQSTRSAEQSVMRPAPSRTAAAVTASIVRD